MEKLSKTIIVLLILAIMFSVISTLLNLSIINFEFKPVNIQIPAPQGNPNGNIQLLIEGNSPAGGAG